MTGFEFDPWGKSDHPDVEVPWDEPPWEVEAPEIQAAEQETADRVKVRADLLRGQLLDVEGLATIPPAVPLVEDWLMTNSLAWLGGKPGHAKTFVAIELGCCVATGLPWHGHRASQGRVLYVIAEGASGLGRRVDSWALDHGTRPADIRFLPVPVKLLEPVDVFAFTLLLGDLHPDLVIIDTQARVTVGAEENSSRDMGRFVETLEALRRASGACILVVHHEPRNAENLRGSTALEGAATTILRAHKDGPLVTVANTKQKDHEESPDLLLALTPIAQSCVLSHEGVGILSQLTASENELLTVLWDSFGTGGATKTEFKEASEMPKSTFYRTANSLVSKGKVVAQKEGRSTRYLPAVLDGQPEIPTSPSESQRPRDS